MSKKSSMQEYLDLYESLRGSGSYSKWLKQQGVTPKDARGEIGNALSDYLRGLPTYGAKAESLGQKGLGKSGYSHLLAEEEGQKLSGRIANAKQDAREAMGEHLPTYYEYLTRMGEGAEGVVEELRTQGISTYDTAYAYSLNAGLDKDTAALTATLLSNMESKPKNAATVQQRATILNRMLELDLTRDAAYAYALSCGVGEEVAKELADAVYTVAAGQEKNHLLYY